MLLLILLLLLLLLLLFILDMFSLLNTERVCLIVLYALCVHYYSLGKK